MDNQTIASFIDLISDNGTTLDPPLKILNGSSSDDGMTDEDWFGFITEGIMLTSISTCGFIGNVLSVWVLLRTTLRGNFSYQLTSLAAYDALFLVTAIMTFGVPKIAPEYRRQTAFLYLMPICYGLVHTFRVGSVLSTVSVTLERFFAIVFPLRDVTCIKRWLIPMTTVFTVVYNFPKFFEISCLRDPETKEYIMVGSKLRQNQTPKDPSDAYLKGHRIRPHPDGSPPIDPFVGGLHLNLIVAFSIPIYLGDLYTSIYVVWSKLILTDLLPYFTIVILNSFIIKKIIQSNRFRSRITSSVRHRRSATRSASNVPHILVEGRPSSESDEVRCFEKQRQEHKLGIMLIAVSVMFIVCQSLKMIPDLYEILFCSDKTIPCITTPFVKTCLNLSHLLVCFNSSANFVIYLLAGEKFRKVWFSTFCFGCMKTEMTESTTVRRSHYPLRQSSTRFNGETVQAVPTPSLSFNRSLNRSSAGQQQTTSFGASHQNLQRVNSA